MNPNSSPEQPAIVFLHGGGLSARMWQPVIDRLPGFSCLAPDLPEHGENRSDGPFTLDRAARLVSELIEGLPEQRAHLVGLSLGGAVALNVARLYPQTVNRLMVTGTSAGLSKWLGQLTLASLWMLRFYKPEALIRASARQWGIPPEYAPMFLEDLLHSTTIEFNRTLTQALIDQQLPDQLPGPLLALVGEKETIPAKQAAQKLARLYPQATGRLVPGVGHVWALQNPDLFAATVRAWVTDQPLPDDLTPLK